MPGQLNWVDDSHDVDAAFGSVSSIAYVIDCQTEYFTSLRRLKETIEKVVKVNPNLHIEVLIHKIDGLSDDFRLDIQREIIQRVTDDLADSNLDHLQVSFYLTSIYDRSIHEAFRELCKDLFPKFQPWKICSTHCVFDPALKRHSSLIQLRNCMWLQINLQSTPYLRNMLRLYRHSCRY